MVDCQPGAAMQAAAQKNANGIAALVTLFIFGLYNKTHASFARVCFGIVEIEIKVWRGLMQQPAFLLC